MGDQSRIALQYELKQTKDEVAILLALLEAHTAREDAMMDVLAGMPCDIQDMIPSWAELSQAIEEAETNANRTGWW